MIKPSIFVLAAMFAAPAFAQAADPAAAPAMAAAPASLPMCSAKVKDSCQQTRGQEARAMSAAQAEASGGVGDRGSDQAAMAGSEGKMAMPARHRMMKHHRHMHHKMAKMATEAAPPAADAAAPPPQ